MIKKLFSKKADKNLTKEVFKIYFCNHTTNRVDSNLFFTTLLDHKRLTGCTNVKKAVVNVVNECLMNLGYTCKCSYRIVNSFLKDYYGIDCNLLRF